MAGVESARQPAQLTRHVTGDLELLEVLVEQTLGDHFINRRLGRVVMMMMGNTNDYGIHFRIHSTFAR